MLFGYVTVFLYGMCIRPLLANPRRHMDGAIAIVVHAALLLWVGLDEFDDLCLATLIPFSIASTVGAYLFYAQHNFPGARPEPTHEWDYTTAALDASSYIKMGPVFNWLTANIGYHHVHHLNSRIPFYRLPEAMRALPELQSPGTSTLRPVDIYACLRLKLWDPEAEQLVPWRDSETDSRTGTPSCGCVRSLCSADTRVATARVRRHPPPSESPLRPV
jgi:omega-6 fatty acid desaturase (delta-12 desaturase)